MHIVVVIIALDFVKQCSFFGIGLKITISLNSIAKAMTTLKLHRQLNDQIC